MWLRGANPPDKDHLPAQFPLKPLWLHSQALSWMQPCSKGGPVSSKLLCLLEILKKLVLQRSESWADAP